jgi:hypothetical protein
MDGPSAGLYCPHSKEYCVCFQSKFATLKGIENLWERVAETGGSCDWENQQHGRNHHLKVLLENPVEGHVYAVQLVHEDGGLVPAWSKNKQGARKSTMLVGIEGREVRLGLSWHSVTREGPRKWFPAADVLVRVVGPDWPSLCEAGPTPESLTVLVPAGKDVVIPFRVEVLSASKGAGDFSRYAIELFQTEGKESRAALPRGFRWVSPPMQIEAKWLPAAPVRLNNRSYKLAAQNVAADRLRQQLQSAQQQQHPYLQHASATSEDDGEEEEEEEGGEEETAEASDGDGDGQGGGNDVELAPHGQLGRLVRIKSELPEPFEKSGSCSCSCSGSGSGSGSGSRSTPRHDNVLDRALFQCTQLNQILLNAVLEKESAGRLMQLDIELVELQCTLSQYQLRRHYVASIPQQQEASARLATASALLAAGKRNAPEGEEEQQHQHQQPLQLLQQLHQHQHQHQHQLHELTRDDETQDENVSGRLGNKADSWAPLRLRKQQQAKRAKRGAHHEQDGFSSPPRGPKFMPLDAAAMSVIALPGQASAHADRHEAAYHAPGVFADFELLVSAASAKQSDESGASSADSSNNSFLSTLAGAATDIIAGAAGKAKQ